jgi:hypothetical protein
VIIQKESATTRLGVDGVSVVFHWGNGDYHQSSSGYDKERNFAQVLDSEAPSSSYSDRQVKARWQEIVGRAHFYDWAEYSNDRFPPGSLSNWPKSKYDSFGTNSNVFVREMAGVFVGMREYGGRDHPPSPAHVPQQNYVPGSWLTDPWHPDHGQAPPKPDG